MDNSLLEMVGYKFGYEDTYNPAIIRVDVNIDTTEVYHKIIHEVVEKCDNTGVVCFNIKNMGNIIDAKTSLSQLIESADSNRRVFFIVNNIDTAGEIGVSLADSFLRLLGVCAAKSAMYGIVPIMISDSISFDWSNYSNAGTLIGTVSDEVEV